MRKFVITESALFIGVLLFIGDYFAAATHLLVTLILLASLNKQNTEDG